VIYIREAHALDSAWPMASSDAPLVEDPVLLRERCSVASTCMTRLDLQPMTALVDEMDDRVNRAYEAWPDRLILVDRQGRIAYRGGPGPFGFDPEALLIALERELGKD
jgi:hypothetical protein